MREKRNNFDKHALIILLSVSKILFFFNATSNLVVQLTIIVEYHWNYSTIVLLIHMSSFSHILKQWMIISLTHLSSLSQWILNMSEQKIIIKSTYLFPFWMISLHLWLTDSVLISGWPIISPLLFQHWLNKNLSMIWKIVLLFMKLIYHHRIRLKKSSNCTNVNG